MNSTPAVAERPNTRRSASSPNNGSISSRRQSRISSVVAGRRVPVAIALDFQSDGTCQRHACWLVPDDPTLIPSFHAAPTANSVRVVFHHTPTAEQTQHVGGVQDTQGLSASSTSHEGKPRPIEHCLGCFPNGNNKSTQSLPNNDSVSASNFNDSSDSWTDEISPGASIAQAGVRSTRNSLSASEKQEQLPPSISRSASRSFEEHVAPDEDTASESPSSIRAGEAIMAFAREIASFTMRTYDITKALELWSKSEDTTYLRLSTNVLIRAGDALSKELDHEWRQFHRSWRNEIQLDKFRCIFYTLPYTVGYTWSLDDALEASFSFFSTEHMPQASHALPISDLLWQRLTSHKSFTGLFSGNVHIGGRLLFLDLCAAEVTYWLEFLTALRDVDIGKRPTWGHSPELQRILPEDYKRLVVFSRFVRDLLICQRAAVESLDAEWAPAADIAGKFRPLLFIERHRQHALDTLVRDLNNDAKRQLEEIERETNATSEQSLKRLTIMAGLFLPLSLASAILSMTTRVRGLGAILWDWFGLAVVIVTLALFGYTFTAFWNPYKFDPGDKYMTRKLDRYARGIAKKAAKIVGEDSDHFLSFVPRTIYKTAPILLLLVACACSLVGMFTSVDTGAEALGYGTAGVVGYILLALSVWHLFRHIHPTQWSFWEAFGYRGVRIYLVINARASIGKVCLAVLKGIVVIYRLTIRFFLGRKQVEVDRLLWEDVGQRIKRAWTRLRANNDTEPDEADGKQTPRSKSMRSAVSDEVGDKVEESKRGSQVSLGTRKLADAEEGRIEQPPSSIQHATAPA